MRLRQLSLVFFASLVLTACDKDEEISCSGSGQEFFEASVNAYFEKHPPARGMDSVRVLPGGTYNSHLNWWVVPVDVGAEKWSALLSCDGHLELSGRT
jgi:hypothetical protein